MSLARPNRLAAGGRINRGKPVQFKFNGKTYGGYQGDTVASALLANGVHLIGRSWKYHRPRGIVAAGSEDPNALLQLNEGAYTVPNARATQVELYHGLTARSVNCWPNAKFDLMRASSLVAKFLPAGFYYKTFMWPKSYWMKYEQVIRKAAGLGSAPVEADPDVYEKTYAHTDVLVVGSGPSGLAAALAASRAGARVMLADEQQEFGGSLLHCRQAIDGRPADAFVAAAIAELADNPDVTLLPRSTVYGYLDHNLLTIAQRLTDHRPAGASDGPRERLWRVRARQVVLATGAHERPLAFCNNDRPGIMLASAISAYVNRWAVLPGFQAVVFTNNDSAYQSALDLLDAGAHVAAVVDPRDNPQGELPNRVRARGVKIMAGHVVVDTQGGGRLEGAKVMKLAADKQSVTGEIHGIGCDLLAVSGGWSPVIHLSSQSGAKARWSEEQACFLPGEPMQAEVSVGSAAGVFDLAGCLAGGFEAGGKAAGAAGFGDGSVVGVPAVDTLAEEALLPMWLVPGVKPHGRGPKAFVDMQNDVGASDLQLALREGFESIEHVKRYTAMGFGTDQGKLGNIIGMGIVAQGLNAPIPQVGTTTFRPNYTPVTFGAIAGPDLGDFFDPIRKTPTHAWVEAQGAPFENVGQWKRAWYFPKAGESLHAAVDRECLATRNSVGVMDASTLGKIDIQGPDAAAFLNWVYTNNWDNLKVGSCRYGLMLDENGMVIDDGVTTRIGEHHYYMTTTTGGAARVMAWLERWLQTEWPHMQVYLTSQTDHWATIAVVGPKSRAVVAKLVEGVDLSAEAFPFMTFREGTICGVPGRVMRVSFSGELAFELNVPSEYGHALWEQVMAAGEEFGITPYGTETMHVLRAEKGYIIVGQDTDGSITPIDLQMDWIVSKKKDFLGKRSLSREDTARPDRKQLVGLLTENPKDVLPEGAQIVRDPNHPAPNPMCGHVTSSYWSANLNKSIAFALLKNGRNRVGETVYAPLSDGRVIKATIGKPIFIDDKGRDEEQSFADFYKG